MRAGVVSGQGMFPFSSPLIQHRAQIIRAELQVDSRLIQHGCAELAYPGVSGNLTACARQHLRETVCVLMRTRLGVEFRLLPDQSREDVWIESAQAGGGHH